MHCAQVRSPAAAGRQTPPRSRTALGLAGLLAVLGAQLFLAPPAMAVGCTVNADGSADHVTIGAALADAACTTISVAAGTYEEHITVNRAVTIEGAGADTIIDGGGSGGAVVRNRANGVVIDGVTITGGGGGDAGGIHSTGDLTVQESVIVDNRGEMGGAIVSIFALPNIPMLTVIDTLITENWGSIGSDNRQCNAPVSGGIVSVGRGFQLLRTTMVLNQGGGLANAIFFEHESAAGHSANTSLIEDSTLSNNRGGCGGTQAKQLASNVIWGTAGALDIRGSLLEGEKYDFSHFPISSAVEISGPLLIEDSTFRELERAVSAFVPTTIRNSRFEDNTYDVDVENAAVTIEDTHFESRSGFSRGIFYEGGDLTMRNSSMSGRWARNLSGQPPHPAIGIDGDALLENNTIMDAQRGIELVGGSLELVNNTITNNEHSGVARIADTVTLRNNVIADNGTDCVGDVTDFPFNLDTDGTCASDARGRTVDDPLLGPLRDNGGATPTRLPLAGSPVIDAADSVGCPATDQRGVTRPRDGGGDPDTPCDIGSVELDGIARPVAMGPVLSTTTDTALAIQLVATDADGDPLTLTTTQPASGTLACDTAVSCTYTPDSGFTGTDTFTFVANDGVNDSNTATVTIAVATAIESNPLAIAVPGGEGATAGVASLYPSTIDVAGLAGPIIDLDLILHDLTHTFPSDIDILLVAPDGSTNAIVMSDAGGLQGVSDVDILLDDEAAEPLSGGALTEGAFRPTNLGGGDSDIFPAPAPASSGAVILSTFDGLDPNGTWSLYVADDALRGIGDIGGGWSLAITTDGPANAAPVAQDQSTSTPEDTPVAIQLAAADADGDALTYSTTEPASGTLGCDPAGACTYTPAAGFTGVDSFTFVANDGTVDSNSATVIVTVEARVPDPPIVSDVTADPNPVTSGEGVTLSATADDSATGGSNITAATYSIDGGLAQPLAAADGAFDSPTEELSATIDASAIDVAGDYQLCVVASDAMGNDSGAVCVTLTVGAANAIPEATPQDVTLDQDSQALITLAGTDADGDALGFAVVDLPSDGSLFEGDSTEEADRVTTAGPLAGDQVTYVPDPGYSGADSFTFTASDGRDTSAPAAVLITVMGSEVLTVVSNGAGTGTVASDPAGIDCGTTCEADFAGGTTLTLTATPDAGSFLSGFSGCDSVAGDQCSVTIDDDTTVTVTFDDSAPLVSDVAADPNPVTLGQGVTLTVTADDSATEGSNIAGATYSIDGGFAQPLAAADGAFDSPTEALRATIDALALDVAGDYEVCVVASDELGNDSEASCIALTVVAANAIPEATPQDVTLDQDGQALITLAGTDADADALSFAVVDLPINGSLFEGDSTEEADRITTAGPLAGDQVTYVPDPGYSGADSFTFTASDGRDTSAPAAAAITVNSDVLHIYDGLVTSGERTRSGGTFTCEAGQVFAIDAVLTQDGGASAEGRARGTCTGEEQRYRLTLVTEAGSTLEAGTAEVCVTLRSAERGARMAEETVEVCQEVDVYLGSRSVV